MGGEKITYYGPVSTPTVYLTIDKLHCNSLLSTPYGKCLIVYFNNLYLENPMDKDKYYKIEINIILQEIIDKYDLNKKQIDGYIYVRV